jgi:hypothetical protein
MVFLKAQLSGKDDDVEFLLKCLVEHIENDIRKAIGDEPLDADLMSGKKRIKRDKITGEPDKKIDGYVSPRVKSKLERRKKPMSAKERKYRESLPASKYGSTSDRELPKSKKDTPKKTETREFAVYTSKDEEGGNIPAGKKVGDRKPVPPTTRVETSEMREERRAKFPTKKLTNTPITGEMVFSNLASKEALANLKKVLNNKETKLYLKRLKQDAVKFPHENLKGSEFNRELREFLTTSAQSKKFGGFTGEGATKEVLNYLMDALDKILETSKDGTTISAVRKLKATIKNRDEELKLKLKQAREKQKKSMSGKVKSGVDKRGKEVREKVSGTTSKFFRELSSAFRDLGRDLSKNESKAEVRIAPLLSKYGDEFLIAILRLIDTRGTVKVIENKVQELPDDIYESSASPFRRKKKEERRGVEVLSQRKLPTTSYDPVESAIEESQKKYTEEDKKYNLIPKGKKVGDSKAFRTTTIEKPEKLKKSEESVFGFQMLDVILSRGKHRISLREQPYTDKSEGFKDMQENIGKISSELKIKMDGGNTLFQKIKEIAAKKNSKLAAKDFNTPEEKEEYKKNIQGYMNARLKEIVGQHKLQRKVSKIPKTLINQHDELTKEIVADLRKFYSFSKNMEIVSGQSKIKIEQMPKDGYVRLFSLPPVIDIGSKLQESIDLAKEIDDSEKKRLTEEQLREYEDNDTMMKEVVQQLEDISETLNKDTGQIKIVMGFINFMEKTKIKYMKVVSDVRQIMSKKISDKGDYERITKALEIKYRIEEKIIERLNQFSMILDIDRWGFKAHQEKFKEFLESLPDIEGVQRPIEIEDVSRRFNMDMVEGTFFDFFEAFSKANFKTLLDIEIDIKELQRKQKSLEDKAEEINKYTTQRKGEAKEKELLLQFFEIKQKRLSGEKITEKPKMLDRLLDSFIDSPIVDLQGKKLTKFDEIARYLEEKYSKDLDIEGADLIDYVGSFTEERARKTKESIERSKKKEGGNKE